jgi:hypothetical protein
MYNLKRNWVRLYESLRIELNVKLELKWKIIKIKMTVYIGIYFVSCTLVLLLYFFLGDYVFSYKNVVSNLIGL